MSVEKIRKEFEIEFDSYLLKDGWNQASLGMMKDRDSEGEYTAARTQGAWWAWQASRAAVWQPIDTCPQHQDVLFFRSDAGVFAGMITDADHFMSDKERDEWEGTEEEMFELDAFGYGDFGVCRCDGSERPTHWMPLPAEPEVTP